MVAFRGPRLLEPRRPQNRHGAFCFAMCGVAAATLLLLRAHMELGSQSIEGSASSQAISSPEHGGIAGNSVAFVAGTGATSGRRLLSRRIDDSEPPAVDDTDAADGSAVAMRGSARRNNRYNQPKKLHVRYIEFLDRRNVLMTPTWLQKLSWKKEPTIEKWSQTLKLTFPEGEDDVVTVEEVMDYFTTDEYKPEAVVVGHQLPHETIKHAYVHFATNEAAIKARHEKDGGTIGKASEVKAVYTDEKKWVRLRDGVQLTGGPRASWMKAYGGAYDYMDTNWKAESASRSHPVYPE